MMKQSHLIRLFLLCLLTMAFNAMAFNAQASANQQDIKLITAGLNAYLHGHIKGDKKLLGSALHTQGKLSYLRDGNYAQLEFDAYLSRMKLRNTNDGIERVPYIRSIEVNGNMAIAKLVLDYSSRLFTDYMTLFKINGEWKIVNKIAYSVVNPSNNKAINPDIRALYVTLNNYADFYKTADKKFLESAFYESAKVMWGKDKVHYSLPINDFIKSPQSKAGKKDERPTMSIERIDLTGNVAIAKIERQYDNATVSSYLSLMLLKGDWKIVNEAFNENK